MNHSTQVDDVLNFPYKFNRMVNNKRVVVGLKQERILKLKQCIEESDEGESAVYLVHEDTNAKVLGEPNYVQEPNQVIQGAINVAWTIRKTEYLKNEMEKVNQEINNTECPVDVRKKFQLSAKTLKKNRECVETAFTSLQDLQQELTSARQEYFDSGSKSEHRAESVKVDQLEKNLQSQLTKMRKAQDALRKSIDA